MTIVVLASATGSPGVTTLALGLALEWPHDVLVVDADRQPGQAVQAGFLAGAAPAGGGLTGLARVHRERRPLDGELLLHCVPLVEVRDEQPRRLFLPGFSHPNAPGLFGPVWPELADALAARSENGLDVLIDGGRHGDGLPEPILAIADAVLLVARSDLRSLAAVRLHLPVLRQRLDQLGGSTRLGLVIIGPGRPYENREIQDWFGVPVWGGVPHDPQGARVWSDGEPGGGRFSASGLSRGVRTLAEEIGVRTQRTRTRR